MEGGTDIINIAGILNIYREDHTDEGHHFNEEDYKEFIQYLEIDFFDWVKENLNQFRIHKNSQRE